MHHLAGPLESNISQSQSPRGFPPQPLVSRLRHLLQEGLCLTPRGSPSVVNRFWVLGNLSLFPAVLLRTDGKRSFQKCFWGKRVSE